MGSVFGRRVGRFQPREYSLFLMKTGFWQVRLLEYVRFSSSLYKNSSKLYGFGVRPLWRPASVKFGFFSMFDSHLAYKKYSSKLYGFGVRPLPLRKTVFKFWVRHAPLKPLPRIPEVRPRSRELARGRGPTPPATGWPTCWWSTRCAFGRHFLMHRLQFVFACAFCFKLRAIRPCGAHVSACGA